MWMVQTQAENRLFSPFSPPVFALLRSSEGEKKRKKVLLAVKYKYDNILKNSLDFSVGLQYT